MRSSRAADRTAPRRGPRHASGPASMRAGSSWWPRIRPSRVVSATSMLVAPRSATRTWPASRPERELARRPAAGAGPGVALDDEPAIDQLADALGDDRPAEPGPRDELRARARPPEADLVEDGARARRAPRRAAGRGRRRRSSRSMPVAAAMSALDTPNGRTCVRTFCCLPVPKVACGAARSNRSTGVDRVGAAPVPSRCDHLDGLDNRSPTRAYRQWSWMSRIADIGAAVIGTGFIGTVHVEALRRIGVARPRRARQLARAGAARADALGVRARLRVPRRAARRRRPSTSSTSPRPTTCTSPQAKAILAAGKHVVCEKPLAMTAAESAGLVALRPRDRPRQRRRTSTSATTRSTSTPARLVAGGDARRRPARHRPLLPGLAAARHRLELAAAARARRRAARGRRHRLALARPDDVRDRPARRRGHGRPGDVHRRPATSRPARSRRSRPSGRPTPSSAPIATEDTASILLRFDGGARGAVSISQISAGRKNSLQYEIDGSERPRRLGLGAARTRPVDRPPRPPERDPDPQPGAAWAPPAARRPPCRAATSRASSTRSARTSGPSTRTWSPGAVRPTRLSDVRRRPRRDARRRRDRAQRPRGSLGGRRSRLARDAGVTPAASRATRSRSEAHIR